MTPTPPAETEAPLDTVRRLLISFRTCIERARDTMTRLSPTMNHVNQRARERDLAELEIIDFVRAALTPKPLSVEPEDEEKEISALVISLEMALGNYDLARGLMFDIRAAIKTITDLRRRIAELRAERGDFLDTIEAVAVNGLGWPSPKATDTVWPDKPLMSEAVANLRQRAETAESALAECRAKENVVDPPEAIRKLLSQLAECRAKVIEECAAVADQRFAGVSYDAVSQGRIIGQAIRALATKEAPRHE